MTSSERSRAYYLANRERLIAKQKVYAQSHSAEVSASRKAWAERNRERIKAQNAAKYAATRDEKLAYQKQYASDNADAVRAYKKAWAERNSARIKLQKAEKYLANREAVLAKCKAAYEANPGPAKARAIAYAQANHEIVRAKGREQGKRYREQYPDRVRERHKSYELAKPEKRRQITARRRARERAARVDPFVDYTAVLKAFTGSCGICRKPLDINTDKYHFDHIVAIAVGGSHDAANLQIAHARCNLAKGKKAVA